MTKKTLFATAVVGGALLVVAPASAGEHHRDGGVRVAGNFCAAPWQWNGPLSLLHEGHAPGYAACADNRATGGAGVGVPADACVTPWRWNDPLEIFTVDRSRSSAACDGNLSGR